MSLRQSTTIDDLLGDPVVQAMMRADRVEAQALRTMLVSAAGRLAAPGPKEAARAFCVGPPVARRAQPRDASAPARPRARALGGACGSALCC
jgi:hypothetical protein